MLGEVPVNFLPMKESNYSYSIIFNKYSHSIITNPQSEIARCTCQFFKCGMSLRLDDDSISCRASLIAKSSFLSCNLEISLLKLDATSTSIAILVVYLLCRKKISMGASHFSVLHL